MKQHWRLKFPLFAMLPLLVVCAIVSASALADPARPGPPHFNAVAPNGPLALPSQCADWVTTGLRGGEVRPENKSANATIPTPDELAAFHAKPLFHSEIPASDFALVDGSFSGTTDQILTWAACKWGIDEDLYRAQAWTESKWKQGAAGDQRTDPEKCQAGNWNGWNGSSCMQSYGILQVKVFDFNTWPEARDSTAFNADFRAAYHRACMNGDIAYLRERNPPPGYPSYPASDVEQATWGCMGNWMSGGWFDPAAQKYIAELRENLASRPWLQLKP